MLNLKIGEKELKVKFGYEATLKTRLLSRVAKREAKNENSDKSEVENIEDALLFIPEILLVGLQKFHKEEYGFDYVTGEKKEEQLDKMFALIDEYCDIEGNDVTKLHNDLQGELLEDGFLANKLHKEKAKVKQKMKGPVKVEKTEN